MNENAEASCACGNVTCRVDALKAASKGPPSPVVDFTAGVVAGVTGLVVGQPFDVVKVRYQTPSYNSRYASTFGALGSILREEGTRGLFKGVMSPMAGVAFINGVIFTSYSALMNLQHSSSDSTEPSLAQIGLAGAGSGVLGAFIASPTELVKIRQQSAPSHLNPSTMTVITDIIRKDGLIRGMYRGFSATALRDIAYGPYFVTYEATCRFFRSLKPAPEPSLSPELRRHPNHNSLIEEAEEELRSLSWPELMTAGGLAGVTAWMATFPIDVFKTRMQAVNGSSGKRLSVWRVGTDAVRSEGWRVMFAGLGPTLIRAVPTNMVIFLTFEGVVAALS